MAAWKSTLSRVYSDCCIVTFSPELKQLNLNAQELVHLEWNLHFQLCGFCSSSNQDRRTLVSIRRTLSPQCWIFLLLVLTPLAQHYGGGCCLWPSTLKYRVNTPIWEHNFWFFVSVNIQSANYECKTMFAHEDQVQEEIDRIIGGRQPVVEDRKNLPYTDAVVHEIQRMANIVPASLPHTTSCDVNFKGFFIKKVMLISSHICFKCT